MGNNKQEDLSGFFLVTFNDYDRFQGIEENEGV